MSPSNVQESRSLESQRLECLLPISREAVVREPYLHTVGRPLRGSIIGRNGRGAVVVVAVVDAATARREGILHGRGRRAWRVVVLGVSSGYVVWYVQVSTARCRRSVVACICAVLDALHAVEDAGEVALGVFGVLRIVAAVVVVVVVCSIGVFSRVDQRRDSDP
jgi:hypothetical protein